MSIRSGLRALLVGESTISDVVSTRVYVGKAPQTASLPHIIISQLGSEENKALDGTGGLRFVTLDVDIRSQRSIEAESLGNIVRVFLDDYTGAAGSETVLAMLMNSEGSDYEPPTDGSDIGVHTTTLDVTVQYEPA